MLDSSYILVVELVDRWIGGGKVKESIRDEPLNVCVLQQVVVSFIGKKILDLGREKSRALI